MNTSRETVVEHGDIVPETVVRWITLGKDIADQYVLVVHTFEQSTNERARIRIISARRPTKAEVRAYEEKR